MVAHRVGQRESMDENRSLEANGICWCAEEAYINHICNVVSLFWERENEMVTKLKEKSIRNSIHKSVHRTLYVCAIA